MGEELFPKERRQDYVELLKSRLPETELSTIRQCARTGRLLGEESFISEMEGRLKSVFTRRPRGRPRTKGILPSH